MEPELRDLGVLGDPRGEGHYRCQRCDSLQVAMGLYWFSKTKQWVCWECGRFLVQRVAHGKTHDEMLFVMANFCRLHAQERWRQDLREAMLFDHEVL